VNNETFLPDEELEVERVCNGRVVGGQTSPPAKVQEARPGRKPRRSKRGSENASSSPKVAPRSVSEMLGGVTEPVSGQALYNLLDSGRPANQRGPGGDVSCTSENSDRRVSLNVTVSEVKFNDDGARIIFVTYDVPGAAALHALRHQGLRMDLTPN